MEKQSHNNQADWNKKKEESANIKAERRKRWEQYGKTKKPSMKRRCTEHDYYNRGIYMITISIEGRKPLLGSVTGDPNITEGEKAPHVTLTDLGRKVKECWEKIPMFHPAIEVLQLCIMPDHIHGILFVHERMEKHLGKVIEGFKTGTRRAARELGVIASRAAGTPTRTAGLSALVAQNTQQPTGSQKQPASSLAPLPDTQSSTSVGCAAPMAQPPSRHTALGRAHGLLWEPGYHDRILLHKDQLQRLKNYLDDNPRRLLIKRLHPRFFTQYNHITAAGRPMTAMGNPFLLDRPTKIQIQCSRQLTPKEIENRKNDILQTAIDTGAVVVSPCISPGEKAIATAAMAADIPLVVLLLNGFPPYFKPRPAYLQACAIGRLLMLAPFVYQSEKMTDMRQRCLRLNALAAAICQER